MNYIEVNGGNKFQRHIAETVVTQMIKALMPKMKTLEIEVQIKKLTGDAVGWCMMEDTNREFTIEVANNLTLKDLVTTICHEMVHVKQYVRKELFSDVNFYKTREEYLNLPWEVEAYEKQEILYKKWLNTKNQEIK